jgi:hypothetical protein
MTADRHVDAGLMAVRTVVAQPTPDAVLALQTAAAQAFCADKPHYVNLKTAYCIW